MSVAKRIIALAQNHDAISQVICRADLPDEDALKLKDVYPEWAAGVAYFVDEIVQRNDKLYRIVQEHVSQEDWLPEESASLYSEISFTPSGYEEWKQPTGAHDAYSKGDIVSHNGKLWESTFDGANVWEPGVQGTEALWKDVTDEVSSDDQGGVEE